MRTNKNLKLIVISLIIPLSIILGILLFDYQSEGTSHTYSYNFENDEVGSYPTGFVGNWRDTKYTRVIYFDEIHKNIVEVRYLEEPPINPIIGGGMEFNTLFKLTTSGIIEFDIYLLYNKKVGIDICQSDAIYDNDDDIDIHLNGDRSITIKDEFGNHKQISSFSTQKWYHFKIEFDINKWSIWIDETLQQADIRYYQKPPYFCQLYFATYDLGQIFYVDNIEITVNEFSNLYSWDRYIPIFIVILLSVIILFYYFKFSKTKTKTISNKRVK